MDTINIGELAQLAGVSTRTLRHYEQIGLLKPSGWSRAGVREYDQPGILRLQSILVLRQLGLGLEEVAAVLAKDKPLAEALKQQAELLDAQSRKITQMRKAVLATLERLQNGDEIMPAESFEGFAQDPYAQEAQQRWPDNFAQSQQRISKLRPSEQKAILDTHGDIARALAALFRSGVAADAPEVQEQIDRHYRWVCNFWTPDAKAYAALGQMYLDDERFTATYDAFAVGLTPFIRDAILRYAASNLA